MKLPRALWRCARLLGHVLHGLWVVTLRFPRMSQEQQYIRVQAWSQQLLACAGISLRVQGTPPVRGPVMLVANHISWLDITVMHAALHCRFVSKADVKHWPVIGTLATACGTLYVERESRRDAMRVVHHMAESLRAGDILAVFPEGTTGDGVSLLPFHANLLQSAISTDSPLQPVALSFADAATGARSDAPRYVGDDSLVGSVWRTLCAPPIDAVLVFGDAQHAQGRDRRAWSADLRAEIERLRTR